MPAPTRPRRTLRRAAALALASLAAVAFLAGCGSDKPVAPRVTGPTLPPGTPPNTSPDGALVRWLVAYASNVEGEADTLLTSDFHYRFSAQTDPVLDEMYGTGWGKTDEALSLHHLWHGFTNSQGTYVPPASAATVQVVGMTVADDTAHADSSAWYKSVSVLGILLDVNVDTGYGPTVYDIRCPARVLVVRGDAAVLHGGQPASAARWYVRECDDLSTLVALRKGPTTSVPLGAQTATWGELRAQYR